MRQFSTLKPASSITITSFALFFAFGMLNLEDGFSGISGRAIATVAGAGFAEELLWLSEVEFDFELELELELDDKPADCFGAAACA